MGSVGLPEILLIALVALLLFGAGRIADIGKGLGQGIKNFKQGLKEADEVNADTSQRPADGADGASTASSKKSEGEATPAAKQA
jgi:sec-independent protein translocase protein TatA